MFSVLFFSFVYALKGASIPWIADKMDGMRARSKALGFVFSADFTASFLVFLFTLLAVTSLQDAALVAVAFWLACAPSMGEEHGAVGRLGDCWGEYIAKGFGRTYGVKKAVQRGVWIGACMTAVTGYVPFIWCSLLFVPAVFVGQELHYRIFKQNGWAVAEPIIGAVVFGVPFCLWLMEREGGVYVW